jgi:hypothetical protein
MNTAVRLLFNAGAGNIVLPLIVSISDPEAGAKDTIIEGKRADGSLIIPGGKRSALISIKGYLVNHAGYAALTSDMNSLRTNIANSLATLTLQHYASAVWSDDWTYTVKRQGEIRFSPDNLRTDFQEYTIDFLIVSF